MATNDTKLLLRLPTDLKEEAEATAEGIGLTLSEFTRRVLSAAVAWVKGGEFRSADGQLTIEFEVRREIVESAVRDMLVDMMKDGELSEMVQGVVQESRRREAKGGAKSKRSSANVNRRSTGSQRKS